MGGKVQSGNFNHDRDCGLAEAVRQAAVSGVAQSSAGQRASDQAEIAWARACLVSCRVNNNSQGMEPFISVLKALGTGGA
jgi:hypothetical protein